MFAAKQVVGCGSNNMGGTTLAVHDSQLIDTFLWSAPSSPGTEKGVNNASSVLISLISQREITPSLLPLQRTQYREGSLPLDRLQKLWAWGVARAAGE